MFDNVPLFILDQKPLKNKRLKIYAFKSKLYYAFRWLTQLIGFKTATLKISRDLNAIHIIFVIYDDIAKCGPNCTPIPKNHCIYCNIAIIIVIYDNIQSVINMTIDIIFISIIK